MPDQKNTTDELWELVQKGLIGHEPEDVASLVVEEILNGHAQFNLHEVDDNKHLYQYTVMIPMTVVFVDDENEVIKQYTRPQ